MKIIKKRYWAFVLYPESAPENWKDIIQQTGIQCCISPLHDKDINANGVIKKPHYHILLIFEGPTTYNSVCTSFTEKLNQPIPQPIDSLTGYYRYLTHKDNPEKAQYNENEIFTINGFNIKNFNEITYTEKLKLIKSIQCFIREHKITEYSDLCDLLLDNDLNDMYDICVHNAFLFDKYISSRRNKFNHKINDYINK